MDLKELKVKLNMLVDNIGLLSSWSSYQRLLKNIDENGLSLFYLIVRNRNVELSKVSEAFLCAFYNSLSRAILRDNRSLSLFSSYKHDQVRCAFVELDKELQQIVRNNIAYNASRKKPPQGLSGRRVSDLTDLNLLNKEFSKTKRHVPIRQLINRAGAAIKTLKPVFMMSPLSVAQFLESGKHEFDIVIMDEASQILPQDALGAIARGKQLIVVGDSKQLPPTTFFMSEFDADEEEEKGLADDMDSILDLCESDSSYFGKARLRWHYRSIHESLIAFSNSHWYDNDLLLFPSIDSSCKDIGIRFHYVENAKYSNGKNEKEALAVAQRIIEHYQKTPHLSLGVGTINVKQKEIIEDLLDMLKKRDSSVERLLESVANRDHNEPLFIKNLENLQGDERDVIFISCTYGPDSETNKVFQRFGPINSKNGPRRLNVLFSRAKRRMEIFSSMLPEDIVGGPEASLGANALKSFLTYAKTGKLPEYGTNNNRPPGSDFEISVSKSLAQHGYETVAQVGVSGYFIDLAVKNPHRPGEFILGVECDGAGYHSSVFARDRDRLREEVLKSRGWNIHRIWSTDWYKDRAKELSKLLDFLNDLVSLTRPVVVECPVEEPKEKTRLVDAEASLFDYINKTVQSERLTDDELRNRIEQFLQENLGELCEEGISIRDDRILEPIVKKRITSMVAFNAAIPVDIRAQLISEEIPLLHDIFQIVESGS